MNRSFHFRCRHLIRHGFSLIEMLAILVIVGIVLAIAIPSIASIRETSRQVQCSSNLREHARAAIVFDTVRRRLPAGAVLEWGHDWHFSLLPYLDQPELAREVPLGEAGFASGKDSKSRLLVDSTQRVMKVKQCPVQHSGMYESRSINGISKRAISSYSGNAGSDVRIDLLSSTQTDMTRSNGLFLAVQPWSDSELPMGIPLANVTDGLSNTVLCGEVRYAVDEFCGVCDRYYHYHPDFDVLRGTDFSECVASTYFRINDTKSENAKELSFGSFHSGGANLAKCDGSVEFFAETTSVQVIRELGSRFTQR